MASKCTWHSKICFYFIYLFFYYYYTYRYIYGVAFLEQPVAFVGVYKPRLLCIYLLTYLF